MINEINYISINELASRLLENPLLSDINIEQIVRHTLDLWKNDNEAFKDKTLLRYELDYIYKLKYNPYKAKFNNKTIFQFKFIREIKQGISKEIQKGNIDAILKYK